MESLYTKEVIAFPRKNPPQVEHEFGGEANEALDSGLKSADAAGVVGPGEAVLVAPAVVGVLRMPSARQTSATSQALGPVAIRTTEEVLDLVGGPTLAFDPFYWGADSFAAPLAFRHSGAT
jgi:hypothetical protein